jgi:hypothetical protein
MDWFEGMALEMEGDRVNVTKVMDCYVAVIIGICW